MIELTKEQLKAVSFLKGKTVSHSMKDRISTLSGVAGGGKSTTITEFVKDILRSDKFAKIGILAPTNKAVAVNRKMCFDAGLDASDVECRTVHSALGLKHKLVDGNEVYVPDEFMIRTQYSYALIDECSMIDDDLLEYIEESDWHKIIFVGDECQIAPVNYERGEVSRTFTKYEDNIVRLDKVVRQAENNPIIALSTEIRESQKNEVSWPPIAPAVDMFGDGVVVMSNRDWQQKFIETVNLEDPDFARCVAYKNATCKSLNIKVREYLFGTDVYFWKKGETVVSNGARENVYNNNQEFKIIDIEDHVDETHDVPCDILTVVKECGEEITLKVVKEDYKSTLEIRLDKIRKHAREDKSAWKDFWGLKKAFDDIRHVYAITVHKSQGSTFKHTFVFTPDILSLGPTREAKQLLYTATTRSSNSTYFANGR